jgi:hypothetical protein
VEHSSKTTRKFLDAVQAWSRHMRLCHGSAACVARTETLCTIKRGCVLLQFRSISNALYGSERHHSLVRNTVVRYMAANKAEFEPYLGEDWCVIIASVYTVCGQVSAAQDVYTCLAIAAAAATAVYKV